MRIFADLGQLRPQSRILRNTRLTVSYENLFNSRQSVFNTARAVPTGYQPAYRDPIGRTATIEIRKSF